MFFDRALGAAVICAGLYLVIWGKGNDYKDASTNPTQTKLELIGNEKDSVGHEIINMRKEGEQRIVVETV